MPSPFDLPLDHLWQPAPAPAGWLMIVLHGRGDSAQGFTWLQRALGLPGLDLLLLDAPDPYWSGQSWYDLPPHQLPGIQRSRALLDQVLQETARQEHPPERTLLLGFSQGCLMTLEFGARHAQRLAGCIGISGYAYDAAAIVAEMSPAARAGDWLVTHGLHDEVLPITRTRADVATLRQGGLPVDYREYDKGHEIEPSQELPELRRWVRARIAG